MIKWLVPPASKDSLYPDSDGKPMADNTIQHRWIIVIQCNFDVLFADNPDVFVAGDLLWYPVEGEPTTRQAPDVLIVFGRPKGDRGSYMQWVEDGVLIHVVFEILSPGNTTQEMADKYAFYEEYGVEEYYVFDPDRNHLEVYVRQGEVFRRVRDLSGWVSPRLGVRFDLSVTPMVIFRPDGKKFLTFQELSRREAEADLRAKKAEQRADTAEKRAALLADKLRDLGFDVDALKES